MCVEYECQNENARSLLLMHWFCTHIRHSLLLGGIQHHSSTLIRHLMLMLRPDHSSMFGCWNARKWNGNDFCYAVTVANWSLIHFGKCLLPNDEYKWNLLLKQYGACSRMVLVMTATHPIKLHISVCLFVMKDSWIDVNVNSFCFIKSKYWCWLKGISLRKKTQPIFLLSQFFWE